jgi:hypothetical protein
MKIRFLLISTLLLVCMNALALSPPQYTLQNQLENSIGASPCVTVQEIREENGVFLIDVVGCDEAVCAGLAYVLKPEYNYGGIQVQVRVLDKNGVLVEAQESLGDDPMSEIKKLFQDALKDNPYFSKVIDSEQGFFMPALWLEFQAEIIQFFTDNIGDFYGNGNYVAADVFSEVMINDFVQEEDMMYSIFYSTKPKQNGSSVQLFKAFR